VLFSVNGLLKQCERKSNFSVQLYELNSTKYYILSVISAIDLIRMVMVIPANIAFTFMPLTSLFYHCVQRLR